MPEVVGVRFERAGRVYYFAPGELRLNLHDWVVVETAQGLSLGQVVLPARQIDERELDDQLKPVLRVAESHDLLLRSYHDSRELKALERCREKAVELGLEMQPLKAHYSFNGDRVTFYFTADHRVDFRALVRDMARILRTHVEMRQLGPRDELKLLEGWGACGRPLCCATWMTEFNPISIRMAKAQNLPLSPESISGNCGRLCCCLSFEYDRYLHQDEQPPNDEKPWRENA
jgi:cell fate regulator YaaT (PSP1 superfamily)